MAAGWKDALMADTGAPWNIPYVEPGDLVRDYPAASGALGTAIAAGLDIGLGTNVVQTVKTNTFSTTSTSFVDITDFSATITPSRDTSKVLVIANMTISQGTARTGAGVQLVRDSTELYLGDASGSLVRASGFFTSEVNLAGMRGEVSIVFLDSPGVDTATTYKIQARVASSGTFLLGSAGTEDQARTPASITLIEVAA